MSDLRNPFDTEQFPALQADSETPLAVPSDEEQAAFFSRLSAQLDESDVAPEWHARTVGYLHCNPALRRKVLSAAAAVSLSCLAFGAIHVRETSRPAAPIRLPEGYMLLHNADGQVVAAATNERTSDAARQDAWAELQELLSKPSSNSPGDAIAVSSHRP